MKPGLIAIDLDGTLLNSRVEVSPRTVAALKAAHEAGMTLAPATARGYQAAIRPFANAGVPVAAIASAGADIRSTTGEVIEQRTLDGDIAVFLADLCNRAGWTATRLPRNEPTTARTNSHPGQPMPPGG
jgi:HAD superfamily hydrolase (TIGR01484 family)